MIKDINHDKIIDMLQNLYNKTEEELNKITIPFYAIIFAVITYFSFKATHFDCLVKFLIIVTLIVSLSSILLLIWFWPIRVKAIKQTINLLELLKSKNINYLNQEDELMSIINKIESSDIIKRRMIFLSNILFSLSLLLISVIIIITIIKK